MATTSTTLPVSTLTVPLTTIFTPPVSCLGSTYSLLDYDYTDLSDGYLSVYRGYDPACFPEQATLSDGLVAFSPGLCPSAYSIAYTFLEQDTTWATCCPWYMHASSIYYDCGSYPESVPVELLTEGSASPTIHTTGYVWVTPIVIAWQGQDVSLFPHHPTATGTWNVATNVPSPPSPTTTPYFSPTSGSHFIANPTDDEESHRTLSAGAKAGISIGVVVFAAIVGTLIFLMSRRRRRRRRAAAETASAPELHGDSKHVAEAGDGGEIYEKSTKDNAHETAGDTLRHELTEDSQRFEADNKTAVAELEGDLAAELESRTNYTMDIAKTDLDRKEDEQK